MCRFLTYSVVILTFATIWGAALPEDCGISEFLQPNTTNLSNIEEISSLGEFPWTALLGYVDGDGSTTYICEGSLITDRFVLTAAHCSTSRYRITKVRLGEYDKSKDQDCVVIDGKSKCSETVDVNVEYFKNHEDYSSREGINDIALVKLNRSVQFTSFIKPICLPLNNSSLEPIFSVTLAGWRDAETDQFDVLLKIQSKVTPNDICAKKLNTPIPSNQLCAGGDGVQHDWCRSNFGRLAMRLEMNVLPKRWLLEGVMSRGNECGLTGLPSVYTKISEHIDWIINNTS